MFGHLTSHYLLYSQVNGTIDRGSPAATISCRPRRTDNRGHPIALNRFSFDSEEQHPFPQTFFLGFVYFPTNKTDLRLKKKEGRKEDIYIHLVGFLFIICKYFSHAFDIYECETMDVMYVRRKVERRQWLHSVLSK